MKTLALIAAAALVAGPALAQPVTPATDRDAASVYQVYRTTDNQLSCEQLIAEMNTLNASIKKQAEADAKKQPRGGGAGRAVAGGAAAGLLSGAARFGIARNVPGLGYAGAQAAAAASDAAAAQVGSSIAKSGQQAPVAPAAVSDESQRITRVNGLFTAKSC